MDEYIFTCAFCLTHTWTLFLSLLIFSHTLPLFLGVCSLLLYVQNSIISIQIHSRFISISFYAYTYIHTYRIMADIQILAAALQSPTQNTSSVVFTLLIGNFPPVLTCYWLVKCDFKAALYHSSNSSKTGTIRQPATHSHSISSLMYSSVAETEGSIAHPPHVFSWFETRIRCSLFHMRAVI